MAKKVSATEREVIYLEIEQSRINREKGVIVLNKSLLLYFLFMVVGVLGFIFDYFTSTMLNFLIIFGIVILIIGTIPYMLVTTHEERKIKHLLEQYRGGKHG